MSEIIEKITKKLPEGDYLKAKDLVKAGLFPSVQSVRLAIKKNLFPNLKVSTNRVLIPREFLIEYLRKNLHGV